MPSPKKQLTYSSRPNHAARSAHAKGARQFKTYDTSYIRPKRPKWPFAVAVIIGIILLALLIWGLVTAFSGCSKTQDLLSESESATIVVSDGEAASAIATDLQRARLISSTSEFSKRVTELEKESSLLPGTYTFTGGTSVDAIIAKLAVGPDITSVSIPEGMTITNMASRIEEATSGSITAQDFIQATANASDYADLFPFLEEAGENSLEGYLFPKTYDITPTTTAASLIGSMLSQYQAEIASLDYAYPTSQGLNAYQALILASIVEKESPDDAEIRAKVAAVFYNRLATDGEPTYGLLGSDATTAYEIGEDPTDYDWSTESPYNTRLTKGLPPTPICSPSLESLKAVCSPAADFSDYYFFSFWPNGEGGTDYFFDKTYEEHQQTIADHS